MPAVDDEAEFDLLDSIFADLDDATLKDLTREKAAATQINRINSHNNNKSVASQGSYQATIKPQQRREPLGVVRSNSLAALPSKSSPSTSKLPPPKTIQQQPRAKILARTTSNALPFSSTPQSKAKTPLAPLPFARTPLSTTKPFQRIVPQTSASRQPLRAATVQAKVKDDDLLTGIDWSDDEGLLQSTQSQKSKVDAKGKGKARQEDLAATVLGQARLDPNYIPHSKRFTRCVVISVTEKVVKDFRREKTLIVEVQSTKECRRVLLFDEWATTEIEPGDIVNVIGSFEVKASKLPAPSTSAGCSQDDLPTCTLAYSSDNLLILHPDTLISATRASDAHFCRRKAVVQEKVRSSSESTPALVYGNLLHELFEGCFLAMAEPSDATVEERVAEAFSLHRREAEIDKLLKVPKNIESLFTIHIELDEARNHLREKSTTFSDFARQFVGQKPKPDAFLTDPRSRNSDPSTSARIAVSTVHDTEEDVWSPRLGLKGKIDASVQAALVGSSSPAWPLGQEHSMIMPFEIKTGRNTSVMQHRAQTMLYTQMMADRYDRTIEAGLLYYTQTNSLIRVDPVRNELRGLVIGRNDLARYLTPPSAQNSGDNASKIGADDSMADISLLPPQASPLEPKKLLESSEEDALWGDIEEVDLSGICSQPTSASKRAVLPAAIDDIKSCKKCFSADACTLYRRAVDKVKFIASDEDPLQQIYDDRVGHLTDAQCEFFESWENLISLEEREMHRFKKEIWTMSAGERERHGRCFTNMIIDPYFSAERYRLKATASFRYTYRMRRAAAPAVPLATQLLSFTQAHPGTSQVDYTGKPLNSGHMSVGDPVVVSMEPSILALARGYILDLKEDYVEVGLDHSLSILPGGMPTASHSVFRVDKDELQAGMGRIRENLANLFYANGDLQRRRLVVDLERPRFNDPDYKALSIQEQEAAGLNVDQLAAVDKVLKTQDYALILGMPGTGKTTTIAQIIKALTARGKSVLLTSYTHSAVDNILMKIKDLDINILRLGQLNKVKPALGHLTLSAQETPTSIAQLEQRLFAPQVVATTALGIDHPIFTRRRFDYCIVDEASQITLPTCLGPLRFAERFVLVGDHKQLPPLVKNPTARKEGLEISLFRRLSEAHPNSMVYLRHQYRMNADIMAISNRLVYDSTLVCGTPELASRSLAVSPPGGSWRNLCSGCVGVGKPCWLEDITQSSRHVVFVDTDAMPAREERLGRLVQNETEARLIEQTTLALLRCGVTEDQIGVITLYRQQIKLMEGMLSGYKGVEILTADKSQGRDKDCIIMSLTRSNAEKHVGDLIKDWRRLNVCFTRARFKLIIFGSRSTLDEVPHMQEFFALGDEREWIYKLPKGANMKHTFSAPRASNTTFVPASTAPLARRLTELPTLPSSTTNAVTVKRPANTAPAGNTIRSSPLNSDDSVTIDLSFSSSPDARPHKIRKTVESTDKRTSTPKRTTTVVSKMTKDRPILRDILNSQ